MDKIVNKQFHKRAFNYGNDKSYTSSEMIRDAARTLGSHEGYGRQKWVEKVMRLVLLEQLIFYLSGLIF